MFNHYLSVEEGALGRAAVGLLGLDDHDRGVFQVEEHDELPNAEVLEAALHHALFEVAEKSEHLLSRGG